MAKAHKKNPLSGTNGDKKVSRKYYATPLFHLDEPIGNDPEKQLETLAPDYEERVCFIVELYGMAYTKRAVIYAFRQKYSLSLEQTYRYIRIAEWRIAEDAQGTRKEKVQQAINRVKTTIRQAKSAKDFRAAHVAEQYLDKLLGIQAESESPRRPFPTPENGGEDGGQSAGTEELGDESVRALAALIAGEAAKGGGLQPAPVDPQ